MKPTKLSDEQLLELRDMALAGVTPEDIANYFGIAISSVHNYKRQFKSRGVEFPDVRGQRPKGFEAESSPENVKKDYSNGIKVSNSKDYRFVVDGTPITISSNAKSIHIIGPREVYVDFVEDDSRSTK